MKKTPITDLVKQVKKINLSPTKLPTAKALYVFRRDLRAYDNTALIECHKRFKVCPVFIFTPEQIAKNNYKSSNAIQFMIKSLEDLNESIKNQGGELYTYFGDNMDIITTLVKSNDIKAVYINKDYSPYSQKRDKAIEDLCTSLSIEFHSYHDLILTDGFDKVKSKEGKPYYVYSHFFNQASKLPVRKPDFTQIVNWSTLEPNKFHIDDFKEYLLSNSYYTINQHIALQGGRKEALAMLERNLEKWNRYKETRDQPYHKNGTTKLSAHNKFGTISIRELYYHFAGAYGDQCDLNRQLYWRDFYYYLSYWFPETFEGRPLPSKIKYKDLQWGYNDEWLTKWKTGTTGFPIVDAGIRELITTGYMHNRSRMITAMFLTKDLLLDWREGEKFFAQYLIDIDWCQNTGNWHWCDGTGADGSPWLRIFNPWSQQEKVDPECKYIKRFVPELKDVPVKSIHKWFNDWENYAKVDYPQPMVDHEERRKLCLKAYGEDKKLE